jgi:hypothetical protein
MSLKHSQYTLNFSEGIREIPSDIHSDLSRATAVKSLPANLDEIGRLKQASRLQMPRAIKNLSLRTKDTRMINLEIGP